MDSVSVILTFKNFITYPSISPRHATKQKTYMIWKSIARVVKQLNLKVHLVKVKAHSNDITNDIVDSLAKNMAKYSINLIKITHTLLQIHLVNSLGQ